MSWRLVVYALFAFSAMLLAAGAVAGEDGITFFEDYFTSDDGPVDEYKWKVAKLEEASAVSVLNGTMRMYVKGEDRVVAIPLVVVNDYPINIEFMWLQEGDVGHTLEVEVQTSDDTTSWKSVEWFYYHGGSLGWSHGDPSDPEAYNWHSRNANAELWTWYKVEMTIEDRRLTFKASNPGSGIALYDDYWYMGLKEYTRVRIGAYADTNEYTAARIDDFRILGSGPSSETLIVVDEMLPIPVTEDEPRTIDLAEFIHDPDGNSSDIRIETIDLHVIGINGQTVTVLCLEEGGTVEVRLTFTDGPRSTNQFLVLKVQGVNDVPMIYLELPRPGGTYTEEDRIPLEYSITDPDSEQWQSRWTVTGLTNDFFESHDIFIRSSMQHRNYLEFLEPGRYKVEVMVSDYNSEATKSLEMEVQSTDESSTEFWDPWTRSVCSVCVIVLVVAGLPIAYLAYSARKKGRRLTDPVVRPPPARAERPRHRPTKARTSAPPPLPERPPRAPEPAPPPVYSTPAQTPAVRPELQRPSDIPGPSYTRVSQRADLPPTPPSYAWQVTSVKEFISLLPELPNGLPEPLWGIPWEKVATEVVATSTVRTDGLPVCYIGDKAFHADKIDLESFMQPVED